jgi:peptidoglycan/xylan/chitin deacetylase (PgdA/CDA1 family)
MRAVSLAYHDIIKPGRPDSSGLPGPGAAPGKVWSTEFREQLGAVAERVPYWPILARADQMGEFSFLITFDDGGVSAYECAADLLEELGWRGNFFIITDYVDAPRFLSRAQIRALHRRGHLIGSHSSSHPVRISRLSPARIDEEWTGSKQALEQILGEPVEVASIPFGYYSRRVAEAAARAGFRVLFTSEPTTRCRAVGPCRVLGRYAVSRGTSPNTVAELALDRSWPQAQQFACWKLKAVAKMLAGGSYGPFRKFVLGQKFGC